MQDHFHWQLYSTDLTVRKCSPAHNDSLYKIGKQWQQKAEKIVKRIKQEKKSETNEILKKRVLKELKKNIPIAQK